MNDKNKETIFRPELSLELYLNAKHKRSKIVIQDTQDAIVVLEGIKELTTNHTVLIYLDSNDVVVEVDSFINSLDQFESLDANRALAGTIYKQNKDPMIKAIMARTVTDMGKLSADHIDMKKLANFAIRMLWLDIELEDLILIGPNEYFSLRKNQNAWSHYTKELDIRKELSMGEPFIPDVIKKED